LFLTEDGGQRRRRRQGHAVCPRRGRSDRLDGGIVGQGTLDRPIENLAPLPVRFARLGGLG
jgi:hypothetical protein